MARRRLHRIGNRSTRFLPIYDKPPVPTSPMYKAGDPHTSRESARALRGNPLRLGSIQRDAWNLVRRHPGSTAHELDAILGSPDGVRVARRLSELKAAGLVYTKGTKVDSRSGRRCLRWWPVKEGGKPISPTDY